MTLKPYPQYKVSHSPLLGDLPSHWEVARLRSALSIKKEIVGDSWSDHLLLSLTLRGVIPRDMENIFGKLPADFTTYQRVQRGDLIFCLFDVEETPRTVGWVPQDGMLTGAYTAASSTPNFDSNYVAYHFLSYDQRKSLRGYYAGLRNTIRSADFANIPISFPPFEEQQMIVDYLDRELAEIDAFIADQEELIALLGERRTATVTRAVTKGLHADAPLKESGFSWLGGIPSHWETRKIKAFVSTPITDGPHETPEILPSGVPFVSAEAVSSGTINFDKVRGFISAADNLRFSQKYVPRRNDIYMIKSGATTGVCAIVDTDIQFNIWSPLAAIRCNEQTSPRFVLHALRSMNFQESVRLFWNYGTQQNIGMQVLENLPIPYPDLVEQASIAEYLDLECSEIDAAIADAREAIALSKERRAAVISAAVTGKIDVRRALAPASNDLEAESVGVA
ncbi:restriction endonuclease subunit S [Arthrobacter sp. UYEF21]|uniref:restriction endonuclease subunit S n=1 Tax=Arthrobacter sp. UYEF21 TaxID=1756364 RepID=UPI00339113E1